MCAILSSSVELLAPGRQSFPIWTAGLCCGFSVAQWHLTLCDLTDCSTPGFPVLHHLPEFAQTHVHWVGDATQSSHPLLPPSPPAFNLSQHQALFPRPCQGTISDSTFLPSKQSCTLEHKMLKVLKMSSLTNCHLIRKRKLFFFLSFPNIYIYYLNHSLVWAAVTK